MKKQEIKKLSKDQLKNNITKLKKDLFNIRFKKVNGQVTNPSQSSQIKKEISRTMTQSGVKK